MQQETSFCPHYVDAAADDVRKKKKKKKRIRESLDERLSGSAAGAELAGMQAVNIASPDRRG